MKKGFKTISPTAPSERILSIDVLRGFAVLGILIMNIQSFSMIKAAYINPEAYGDLMGINKWIWIVSHFLADEKFMSIFSILFGAGIIMLWQRSVGKGLKAGPIHYRRNFWLLVFGLLHAYLIWYGDILVSYSLCAFLVYVFRKQKPKTLIIISISFFIIPVLIQLFAGYTLPLWPKADYNDNLQSWLPAADIIQKEIRAMQGSWNMVMEQRFGDAFFMQTFLFFYQSFWRVVSMMLLGMALYKWGILSASRSRKFYSRMFFIGLIVGYAIVAYGIYSNFEAQWTVEYSMFFGTQFNYFGSVGVAMGYIGLIMLISKSDFFKGFKRVLSAVGKMAFTNYILMSVICTLIFYGYGLGYYGEIDRVHQSLIVAGIWLIILSISPIWLKYYKYGPIEWLWRGLTYLRFGSNRKGALLDSKQ